MMKSFAYAFGLVLLAVAGPSTGPPSVPPEDVRICSIYGDGFYYIPGTDTCHNPATGDTRQQTEGGTWRTLLPYSEGEWVTKDKPECAPGKLLNVGTYQSTDFVLNAWQRKETAPFMLKLKPGEFISKVIMRGGFSDPRLPVRRGSNIGPGLCLRGKDPDVAEQTGGADVYPIWSGDNLPIGCVANSRIANMPAGYAITSTSAYPSVDAFFLNADQAVSGPYTLGSQLVVTTDWGVGGPNLLTYELADHSRVPMAGSLSVSICVDSEKGGAPSK